MDGTEETDVQRVIPRAPMWNSMGVILVSVVLLGAIGFVVFSSIETSSARVAASTDSSGFLAAGTIEIGRSATTSEFFFDAGNLYPGRTVVGCIEIDYTGSIEAGLRLTARIDGGSGLDRYIDLSVATRSDGICPDDTNASAARDLTEIYAGGLDAFWQTHNSYATGLEITSSMRAGDGVAVVAIVEVVDDNDAAGTTTDLTFVFESRPS